MIEENHPTVRIKHENGYVLGACVHTAGKGWKFLPKVCGREPSRVFFPTAEACIPRWVKKFKNTTRETVEPKAKIVGVASET